MQKLPAFTLCCALAIALAGCSSDKSADSGGTAAAPATPPPVSATTTPPAGETSSATPPAGAPAEQKPAEQKPQSPDGADKKAEPDAKGAAKAADKTRAKGAGAASKDKGSKMVTTASGLQYEDIKVGTGPTPQSGQQVTVDYTGTLADGTKFDSSLDHGQPFTFQIGAGKVIPGWDEGVMTMKVGGKRKLVIPPGLAYGDNPPPGAPIPPGATLTFIVELHGVQ